MSPSILLDCVSTSWSPQIGDPTLLGWVTVTLYFMASVMAALASYKQSGRQGAFWLVLSVLLLILTINKQLDLQSALTAMGRCLAVAQGWYAERQSVQFSFIVAIIGASIVVALLLACAMRREIKRIWLALVGFGCLLAFIAIRAAGFHDFDKFIDYEIGSLRMNWIIEIGGIVMIAANALFTLAHTSTGSKVPKFRKP